MYTLTLTSDERQAFDWVGNRYATGYDFMLLLDECLTEDQSWYDEGDITFNVPEGSAWRLKELADSEDSRFPCYGRELTSKLETFLNDIV